MPSGFCWWAVAATQRSPVALVVAVWALVVQALVVQVLVRLGPQLVGAAAEGPIRLRQALVAAGPAAVERAWLAAALGERRH